MYIQKIIKLRAAFGRLGRDGVSERAHKLIMKYVENNPEIHFKEVCKLIGKLHTLYLAIPTHEYWREIADRGVDEEFDFLTAEDAEDAE
jgi:hypothetical protein